MSEPSPAALREALIEAEEGDPGELTISPIPGGASRETWLIEGEGRSWVLRRDPPGSESLVAPREEFELVRLADEAGVAVPTPLAFEAEGGRFGSSGMLMARVEGTSVGPRILRKPEYEVARERLPPATRRRACADPLDQPRGGGRAASVPARRPREPGSASSPSSSSPTSRGAASRSTRSGFATGRSSATSSGR